MNKLSWCNSRLLILRICSIALVAALPYILLKPKQDIFRSFSMSDRWKIIDSQEVEIEYQALERKEYQEKNNQSLGLEVIFIPNQNGDVSNLIKSHLGFDLKSQDLTTLEDKKIGSYGLFTKDNSTHLSTCIHPQGKTAFSKQQFTELVNYNIRDRIVPWVLGLSDFRDWRCFLVNMSVDLEGITESEATKILQDKLAQIISESKF